MVKERGNCGVAYAAQTAGNAGSKLFIFVQMTGDLETAYRWCREAGCEFIAEPREEPYDDRVFECIDRSDICGKSLSRSPIYRPMRLWHRLLVVVIRR